MDINTVVSGVLMDDTVTISFSQVCQLYQIPEEVLLALLEHGLIEGITPPVERIVFNQSMVRRIQSAQRLQDDLGVNLQGVILALELRDELDAIRCELNRLKRLYAL